MGAGSYWERYWGKRGENIRRYKGEEFYTVTPFPFYVYRRNRILEILNGINVEGKRILDLGCGDGYYSRYLKKRGAEVVGVDISTNMINLAKKTVKKENFEIPFSKMDGKHLDFNDDYFDMVLTVVVIQHVIDQNELNTLLEEIQRVLVGGGRVMIFEGTTRKKMQEDPTSTWIARTFDEYDDLFKGHNLILESHRVISSPFYSCMMLPYNLVRYRLSMPDNNKIELIYSELAVMITKHLDKLWQWKRSGLLHCTFVKEV